MGKTMCQLENALDTVRLLKGEELPKSLDTIFRAMVTVNKKDRQEVSIMKNDISELKVGQEKLTQTVNDLKEQNKLIIELLTKEVTKPECCEKKSFWSLLGKHKVLQYGFVGGIIIIIIGIFALLGVNVSEWGNLVPKNMGDM